ncbi:hypothetical protein [Larsenimonas suaedae]|uniref:Uncharacterized protein n=1 Tax=Larsenimonas suaedae TaxID=1851019 RepID=A0ABU1GYZ8_9GAMM|nr:hypothetical protein [Larsenimonas suaedae]MCM2973766.1 hypothetical protein [Larsenimonas suaedae]MDR5897290.1 hypothetical protein [Larsenimonas suaedae]
MPSNASRQPVPLALTDQQRSDLTTLVQRSADDFEHYTHGPYFSADYAKDPEGAQELIDLYDRADDLIAQLEKPTQHVITLSVETAWLLMKEWWAAQGMLPPVECTAARAEMQSLRDHIIAAHDRPGTAGQ